VKHSLFVKTVLLLNVVCFFPLSAQDYAGATATMEPIMLVDRPTAGMLKRGGYVAGMNLYERGGVLFNISVGVWAPFMFGISYGGTSMIGEQKVDMNPLPGVNVKLRIINESVELPAIVLGFDSQGRGPYYDGIDRYSIKSPGMYAVASKNYTFMGNLSFHGGANISLERGDGDKDLNFFGGIEKSVGSSASLMLEYDPGINDNHGQALGRFRGRGYLNVGVRWSLTAGWVLGVNFKDPFQNQSNTSFGTRTLQLDYTGVF